MNLFSSPTLHNENLIVDFISTVVLLLIATVKWEKKNRKPAKGNTQLHHANNWIAFL